MDPAPVPSAPTTSYGGVSAGLTRYGLSAWYLIGIGLVVGFIIFATAKVQMVFIAVFVAFVLTSLLNPVIRLLSRWMPRAVATTISLLATFVFFGGLLFYVGYSVSGEWNDLSDKFSTGVSQILQFLEKSPIPLGTHTRAQREYPGHSRNGCRNGYRKCGSIATQAVNSAGTVALSLYDTASRSLPRFSSSLQAAKCGCGPSTLYPPEPFESSSQRPLPDGRRSQDMHEDDYYCGNGRPSCTYSAANCEDSLTAPLAVLVMIGAVIARWVPAARWSSQ